MDELSTFELRGAAFAGNLRRAFGAPVEGQLPTEFSHLLKRLSEVAPPPAPERRDSPRLGA
ncbi:hypothetical protein [Rubellimicrobium arenae]|uniref:hypothetical protein n=1 Tax=Rubellimicrobium arenae TaxID=2817372 RepID=UPI001B301AA9|nr:hypothetical protein [Rubellimicrobium arenae]